MRLTTSIEYIFRLPDNIFPLRKLLIEHFRFSELRLDLRLCSLHMHVLRLCYTLWIEYSAWARPSLVFFRVLWRVRLFTHCILSPIIDWHSFDNPPWFYMTSILLTRDKRMFHCHCRSPSRFLVDSEYAFHEINKCIHSIHLALHYNRGFVPALLLGATPTISSRHFFLLFGNKERLHIIQGIKVFDILSTRFKPNSHSELKLLNWFKPVHTLLWLKYEILVLVLRPMNEMLWYWADYLNDSCKLVILRVAWEYRYS